MVEKTISSGRGWTPEEEVRFLFSIVDTHGAIKWHDIPIPPGRTLKACREMLYRLKKRVDAGEGGLPRAKATPKRRAQPKGKSAKGSRSYDAAIARMKIQDGEGGDDDEDENDDGGYESGDGDDFGSPKLKRKRASPKFEKSQKAGVGSSDGDDGATIKGEVDEEDGDIKLGALQTP